MKKEILRDLFPIQAVSGESRASLGRHQGGPEHSVPPLSPLPFFFQLTADRYPKPRPGQRARTSDGGTYGANRGRKRAKSVGATWLGKVLV